MRRRRPRAVAFDFGNTLVEIGYPAAGLRAAGLVLIDRLELAKLPLPAEELGVAVDARVDHLVAAAHRRRPLREVDIEGVYHRALGHVLRRRLPAEAGAVACEALQPPWEEVVSVRPGVLEALVGLRADGLRVGLLSNAPYPPKVLHRILRRVRLAPLLDVAMFSSEVGVRKPSPAVFQLLLDGLGLEAADTWFVGDEWRADIQGAVRAGMVPLLAPGAPPVPDPAVRRLRSFEELGELLHLPSEVGA
ncbi:MAG: HAD family hydrolase [Candidatus Dormibacteria bacterium]